MPIEFAFKPFADLSTGDLYNLLQLRIAVFVVEQQCPYQECDGKDRDAVHLMGFAEGRLMACCRILPPDVSYPGHASIGRVATHPDGRGKGYGKQLMTEAIAWCRTHYDAPVKISAQAYLERFYEDLGFETVSAPYLEDDIPHVAMVLRHRGE